MISHDLQALVPRFLRVTRVIWFAFLGAPLVYCILAWVLTEGGARQFESELPGEAVYLLILVAVLSGPVFSWVIAPALAGPKRMAGSGTNSQLVTDFGEDQPRYERLSETEQKKAQHLGAIQSSFIVRWAGAESVAIFGLLGLLMGLISMYDAWAFCLAAVILLGMLRPDYAAALEKLEV